MNFGLVSRVLGNLLLVESAILSIPLGISLWCKEHQAALAFLITMGILGLSGLFLSNIPAASKRLKIREALLIVTSGWLAASFFGALPFVLSGSAANLTDAFFEAVSGLTTTGATVIENVEILPLGILFWRSFTHWLGGMGILVLALAVLPTLGAGGVQIFKAESPGPAPDKLVPRIAASTKILYTVYLTVTLAQAAVYYACGLSWLESFIFTFGAVGTGGFSIYNDSLARFAPQSGLMGALALGMLFSGINFSLYYDLWKCRWRKVFRDSELRLYAAIVIISVSAVALSIQGRVYSTVGESFKHALFQVSSIITTTGYTSADYDLWPAFSKGVLFALMFVGGCAGSTAGSVKVIRLLVAGKAVKREIRKTLHPQAALPITINGRIVAPEIIAGVANFYFLYLMVFAAGSLLISLEGGDLFDAMGAVAATLGNIGPGFGRSGPGGNFAHFSRASKLLFTALMLFGRLELFTVLAIFTPGFWRE